MVDFSRVHEVKAATIGLMEELWQSNFVANKPRMRHTPGVASLFGRLQGVPALVVGAGPSLDKNIARLAQVKGRGLIIAVDTIYKRLVSTGLSPDMVITLDPQPGIAHFFRNITHHGYLVAPTITHPETLATWRSDLIFFNKFAPDIPVLTQIARNHEDLGVLIPGGSVLTVGFDLAFRLGCNPIAFAGQDLSYPPGGETHAGETFYDGQTLGDVAEKKKDALISEPNIFGRTVVSEKAMAVSRDWMQWAFENFNRGYPARYYNLTEGGIVREGCHIASLAEWAERYCPEGPEKNFVWEIKKGLRRKAGKQRR